MKHVRVIVLGTGTEVGKTHVSRALLAASATLGWTRLGLKPVESGVSEAPADGQALATLSSVTASPAPYLFSPPISPHLAARRARRFIDIESIALWVLGHPPVDLLLVETAGGLFSPLSDTTTNRDLASALAPASMLIVSLDRLGVLHDVAAVLNGLPALPRWGRERPQTPAPAAPADVTVVLNAPERPDESTGSNADELRGLHGVSVHELPRARPEDARSTAPLIPWLEARR